MRDVDDLSYTANIGLPDSFDSLKAAISSAKAAEEGVETAEEAWKRGYLAGALHVSDDFGVELWGLAIEEYSAPKSISVREKEGL
jgi:hypothetical protein